MLIQAIIRAVANSARVATRTAPIQQLGKLTRFSTTVRIQSPTRYDPPEIVARKCIQMRQLDAYGFPTWQDLINYLARQGDAYGVMCADEIAKEFSQTCYIPPIRNEPHGVRVAEATDFRRMKESIDRSIRKYTALKTIAQTGKIDYHHFINLDDAIHYAQTIDDWDTAYALLSHRNNPQYKANSPFEVSPETLAEFRSDAEEFVPPSSEEVAGSKVPDHFEFNKYNPRYTPDSNS